MKSQLPNPLSQLPSVHVPVAQVSAPLARAHAVLHAPQWVSELSGVSQPLTGLPSQSPKPELHAMLAQLPDEHDVTAFGRAHAVLHPPQWVLVLVACSQPLAWLPSQSAKPELHAVIAQLPVAQETAALGRVQATLHPPQLAVVRSDVSQPLAIVPSQLA